MSSKLRRPPTNNNQHQQLVTINDTGTPVTDSRMVAEVTGKRHADVIRKIESLECSIEFAERNIALGSYLDGNTQERKKYNLTRDGMSFLVNKMSGDKAAEFTERFIGAFNAMEAELMKPQAALPDFTNPAEAVRAWATVLQRESSPSVVSFNCNRASYVIDIDSAPYLSASNISYYGGSCIQLSHSL